MTRTRSAALVWAALAVLTRGGEAQSAKRPATVEDTFTQIEEPDQIAPSPDSAWVAVRIDRPARPGEWYVGSSGDVHERSDVWLFSADGTVRRNLTHGAATASGYWEPIWSPQGRRLAMLSSDGTALHVYVWDRQRDRLERVTTQSVGLNINFVAPAGHGGMRASFQHATFAHVRWLSDTTLLFGALPDGRAAAPYRSASTSERIAEASWPLQERGAIPTASVLDVGPGAAQRQPMAPLTLTLANVVSRTTLALAQAPIGEWPRAVGSFSPNGRVLAVLAPLPWELWSASANFTQGYVPPVRLAIVTLDRLTPPRWIAVDSTGFVARERGGRIPMQMYNDGPAIPVWTADGEAVLVHAQRDVATDDRWYRVAVAGDSTPVLTPAPAEPAQDPLRDTAAPMLEVRETPLGRYDLVLHGRDTVLTLNRDVADIDRSRRIPFAYRGTDGDSLTGLVVPPVGYMPGRHYPLVTVVYMGDVKDPKDTIPDFDDAIWAAHGYAVLHPSMPIVGDKEQPGDDFLDVPKGVIPAIDRVIELGYADPGRVGVIGGSYGGFGVYALLALTRRFQAGIAVSGPADLVSEYGIFDPRLRYDSSAIPPTDGVLLERGQFRMGVPPWENLERYLKNSPIAYVDRIETPVMIVQGDMDYVPIQEGEEMFSALYRREKRVQFVRYWGEGHGNVSPANIRDQWEREIKWFDMFLK